ncbi:MAG TPA: CbiX/SirB N-terminal domain-containing protein [Bryobacteraceae bacterium]|nr:CbiX/SirB N-terminal domain-containing protein [Bryobacteraceae bacterium]
MDRKTGIVVFGHGSSVASANAAVAAVADRAASAGGWPLYETAFLECAPRLEDAVGKLVARGASEVVVLPYFLTLGIHLQRDLPVLVDDLAAKYRVPIRVSPPLDGHAGLEKILVDRAEEALS